MDSPWIPVAVKTTNEIAAEWDQLAPFRQRHFDEQLDITFHEVLCPHILDIATTVEASSAVDVGCGTGVLSLKLADSFELVVGIDPSRKSIDIARERAGDAVRYHASSIEEFASNNSAQFELAVANMTLSACVNLGSAVSGIARVLTEGGVFIGTVPHPFFWPMYWGYSNADWFQYQKEQAIEAPFKISAESTGRSSTHLHRPLAMYVQAFVDAGLQIVGTKELMPSEETQAKYTKRWKYPRFLSFEAKKLDPGRIA